ncbi:MAG: hypothetical protein QM640_02960 [Niabella sp.]
MNDEENIFPTLDRLKKEGVSSTGPYQLPGRYFDELEQYLHTAIYTNIPEKAELTEYPLLQSINKKMPFTLPANYLSETQMLPDIPVPYKIPGQYFKSVEQRVLKKLKIAAACKISPVRYWYKIAAAAMITGAIAWGAYQYIHNIALENTPPVYTDRNIENISSEELSNFVEDENNLNIDVPSRAMDENRIFKNVSSSELRNFLDDPGNDEKNAFIN